MIYGVIFCVINVIYNIASFGKSVTGVVVLSNC